MSEEEERPRFVMGSTGIIGLNYLLNGVESCHLYRIHLVVIWFVTQDNTGFVLGLGLGLPIPNFLDLPLIMTTCFGLCGQPIHLFLF